MWYQTFWFTQIVIIAAIVLAFFAFIYPAKKRWAAFIVIVLILLAINGTSLYYQRKFQQKVASFKLINYRINDLKDLSDFEADKYSATVIVEQKLTSVQLKQVIKKATAQILNEKKDASIIWLALFNNDDSAFNKVDDQNPSFIAQTQWKRKGYTGLLPQSFVSNDRYKDIDLYLNPLRQH